ncbi:hypothetical protein [Salinibius halmophilus]|uniref:hypothetical protein n=1 Tax=Salinibius halmophilus TaxID=1853216 RepID=UPI001313F006|nr:hypothetical protein [Salinibius halmophilus]
MRLSYSLLMGSLLLIYALAMLIVQLIQTPELASEWNQWAAPQSGMIYTIVHLSYILLMLAGCVALATCYLNQILLQMPWFFTLVLMTALTGLLGAGLAIVLLIHRVWVAKA